MLQNLHRPKLIRWLIVGALFTLISVVCIKTLVEQAKVDFILASLITAEVTTVLRFAFVDVWVFDCRHSVAIAVAVSWDRSRRNVDIRGTVL